MSEAAWKAEKERIAQRNEETRKAGKKERETQERERAERERVQPPLVTRPDGEPQELERPQGAAAAGLERPQRRGDRRRDQHAGDYRAGAPGHEAAGGHPGGVGPERQAVAVGERLGRHERGEQGRRRAAPRRS